MSTTTQAASSTYLPVRDDWLARRTEAILEPDLPIVDPHHHLWERPGWRYMLDDLLADTNSGHNIVATVFVRTGAEWPVVLALACCDRQVVDAGDAQPHQAMFIELPVLVEWHLTP